MGNRPPSSGICSSTAAQNCVDECTQLQFDLEGRGHDAESECNPAGAVFQETLDGLSPLAQEALRFAGMSNLLAVRWLLAMGAGMQARDKNGTTMLHAACRSGAHSIVVELVRRGMPLDAADSAGWTPLHVAALMGRREVALLLVRAKANPNVANKKGKTPHGVCSDPLTKEVLEDGAVHGGTTPRITSVSQRCALSDGGSPSDEPAPACEPFFVPRLPLFHDEDHRADLIQIGMELFNRSAGHGIGLLVASGIVHDHPVDLTSFLLRHSAEPAQLGKFLGEEYSLSQTLRLAFFFSVDLAGTGVVSALLRCFNKIRPPPDLMRMDRLTSAVAHLWWRTHEPLGEHTMSWEDAGGDDDTEWTQFLEDPSQSPKAREEPEESVEAQGIALRRCLRSAEGLRRLMFSTVMLCWNLHGASRVSNQPHEENNTPRRLSLAAWMEMNAGLEADGSSIPNFVQKGIYEALSQKAGAELLPDLAAMTKPRAVAGGGDGITGDLPACMPMGASRGRLPKVPVEGWASIPRGGLERQEQALQGVNARHCIVSETSDASLMMPGLSSRSMSTEEGGEAVWLSLRLSFILFLSSSPAEMAPYAFLRLQDAVVREIDETSRRLILAGRPKGGDAKTHLGSSPFGDTIRMPLPLCFLLADGRFQPFEASWLEFEFRTDEELSLWSKELGAACSGRSPRDGLVEVIKVDSTLPVRTSSTPASANQRNQALPSARSNSGSPPPPAG